MSLVVRSDFWPEPGDVVVRDPSGFTHYSHRFAPNEVADEAGRAGLGVLHHELWPDGPALWVLE
jgi:hypothetical protein